jgi:hypothetical protein
MLSGCFGLKVSELGPNEQLIIRKQTIGAGVNDLNDTRVRYEGRIRSEEAGS